MLLVVATACGAHEPGAQALASATATPLPSGVVDPAPLVQRATRPGTAVARVDDLAVRLTPTADYLGRGVTSGVSTFMPTSVWVVAIIGEIRPTWGLLQRPNAQCGLFAFRSDTGDVWSTAAGSLSLCQPYFARSLIPPHAAVRCPPSAYDNGVSPAHTFSETRPGPVPLVTVRDDTWRQPSTVPGAFLAQAPEGSVPYEDAFCLRAFVREGPGAQTLLASGIGARWNAAAPFEYAIWLRGYHAVAASADALGHIEVAVEPRDGYEWAFFDWRALVPQGGYVMFRFLDLHGNEALPWRLANGP